MSGYYQEPTLEQIAEFERAELLRDNALKRDWANHGLYLSLQHKQWAEEQERRKSATAKATANHPISGPQHPAGESSAHQTNYGNTEDYDQNVAPYSPSICSEYNDKSVSAGVQETAHLIDRSDYCFGNMTMTQLRKNRCNIEMHSSTIGWHGMKAILDTGSDENWISKEIVECLNLPVNRGVVFKYKEADGSRLESGATVSFRWGIQGQSKTNMAEFRVVTNGTAPFDVLLGSNLITSNQINFNDEERPHGVIVGPEETQAEKQATAESSQISQQEIEALKEQRKTQKSHKKERSTRSSEVGGGSKRSSGKPKK